MMRWRHDGIMSVANNTFLSQHVGNGSTVTPYVTGFVFGANDWLRVAVTDAAGTVTQLTEGTDYTVTGAGDPAGGNVLTLVAWDSTHQISILRKTPITQLLDLVNNDRLPTTMLEAALDKLTMIIQEFSTTSTDAGSSIRLPFTDPSGSNTDTLPPAAQRVNSVLWFGSVGEMTIKPVAMLAQVLIPYLPVGTNGTGSLALGTYFTESKNNASPNNTVSVAALTVKGTSEDLALVPTGNGAFLLAIPNGLTSGGNKRGQSAVDLQMVRTGASQVASGAWSAISGGTGNTASGQQSAIGGGSGNTASGSNSVVAGGSSNVTSAGSCTVAGGNANTASATSATVSGGQNNTASGQGATVNGGFGNTANGDYSSASGLNATTRGLRGASVSGAGNFGSAGDCQRGVYLLNATTTNATQTEATLGGATAGATTRVILPNTSAYKFRAQAVARSSAGDVKSWDISGTIKRGAAAANTAIVGSVTVTAKDADSGASAWALAFDADTTAGGLRVQVTGAAATTIHWGISIETFEVI